MKIYAERKNERVCNCQVIKAIEDLYKQQNFYPLDQLATNFIHSLPINNIPTSCIVDIDSNYFGITNGRSNIGVLVKQELKDLIISEARKQGIPMRSQKKWEANIENIIFLYDLR